MPESRKGELHDGSRIEDGQVSDALLRESADVTCPACDSYRGEADVLRDMKDDWIRRYDALHKDYLRYREALERIAQDQRLHVYFPDVHEIALEALSA
jgi:hypothetical protein